MSRINTNVSSLIAQRALANNQSQLNTSLERLSTGLQINSGADNPSGLIASKALDAEKTGIQTAINNASLANNVIGTAEGGLNEVSNLLTQLTGLVNQSANTGALSSDEVAANQLQVDSILNTINRIAGYWRNQIVMSCEKAGPLQRVLASVREKGKLAQGERIAVDVDPVSLL